MVKVSTLEVPDELRKMFESLISVLNSRQGGTMKKHGYLLSRQRVNDLTTRSLLPQIAELKKGLSPEEVLAWRAAAQANGQNFYNLFVQDTAYRLKFGLPGVAIPSVLHQYKVGRLEITAPAYQAVLAQYHPIRYYISKKIRGNTTVREDIAIDEKLVLPLKIGLSYRTALAPTQVNPEAKFYAIVKSSYQGRTFETEFGFDFDLSTSWKRQETIVAEVIGVARSYDLFIELRGVRGWFEWDNVISEHTGNNYARDFRCNDVNNTLTKTHYMIEKSWEEELLPRGAAFDSVYPAD